MKNQKSAYNFKLIDFFNGERQIRIYKNPITSKPLSNFKKQESIRNHKDLLYLNMVDAFDSKDRKLFEDLKKITNEATYSLLMTNRRNPEKLRDFYYSSIDSFWLEVFKNEAREELVSVAFDEYTEKLKLKKEPKEKFKEELKKKIKKLEKKINKLASEKLEVFKNENFENFFLFETFPNPYESSHELLDPNLFEKKVDTRTEEEKQKAKECSRKVSCHRARNELYNLVRCNEFKYWVTFTFDAAKVDRMDYNACQKALSDYLHLMRKKNPDMTFLYIPELHKTGGWHFHALFNNVDFDLVHALNNKRFNKDGSPNIYYLTPLYTDFKTKDKPIYNIKSAESRMGYNTCIEITQNSSGRLGNYLTKYITKDMFNDKKYIDANGQLQTNIFFHKKKFKCSQNLRRPNVSTTFIDDFEKIYDIIKPFGDCTHSKMSSFEAKEQNFSQKVIYLEMKEREKTAKKFQIVDDDGVIHCDISLNAKNSKSSKKAKAPLSTTSCASRKLYCFPLEEECSSPFKIQMLDDLIKEQKDKRMLLEKYANGEITNESLAFKLSGEVSEVIFKIKQERAKNETFEEAKPVTDEQSKKGLLKNKKTNVHEKRFLLICKQLAGECQIDYRYKEAVFDYLTLIECGKYESVDCEEIRDNLKIIRFYEKFYFSEYPLHFFV